ncbi:MAG TPA: type II toxin-antitoxin system VapC family toxin [Candidatus Deferrimicrobiaceae bacterium]|nr:type II toxin-antitoxin system VapC family toxin [Candidatus Deferrimicrobiaceae bacterium]
MSIYLDTSFLVSLYLSDRHSPEARHRIQSAPPLWLSPLHSAEWAHSIGQHIFRKELSPSEAQRMNARMEEHVSAGRWVLVPMPENAFELCAELARRYGPKLGMKTLDTLHVACALELKAERFWTFDDRQAKLAKAAGLKTS